MVSIWLSSSNRSPRICQPSPELFHQLDIGGRRATSRTVHISKRFNFSDLRSHCFWVYIIVFSLSFSNKQENQKNSQKSQKKMSRTTSLIQLRFSRAPPLFPPLKKADNTRPSYEKTYGSLLRNSILPDTQVHLSFFTASSKTDSLGKHSGWYFSSCDQFKDQFTKPANSIRRRYHFSPRFCPIPPPQRKARQPGKGTTAQFRPSHTTFPPKHQKIFKMIRGCLFFLCFVAASFVFHTLWIKHPLRHFKMNHPIFWYSLFYWAFFLICSSLSRKTFLKITGMRATKAMEQRIKRVDGLISSSIDVIRCKTDPVLVHI